MIACVGILVADVMVKPVSALPKRGSLERVDKIELHTGGNALTAARNIKKMGISSAAVGKIGCDALGDFLLSELKKDGVDTRSVSRSDTAQTSASAALISEDGERCFLHCVGADGVFRMSDVDRNVIDESEIVFVTGIFLLDEFDTYDLAEFLKRCKKMGKITAADVCWDAEGRWGSVINAALPYIDIFLPSIDEAKMIAGKEAPKDCADVFFEKGVGSVVIKLGGDGCYARKSREEQGKSYPCCRGVVPVDTTGAGDSFCSGFLAALSKGKEFYECVRFANAAGALCVMSMGASTGMKSYEETEKFMNERI